MALIPIPIRFENILASPALEPAPLLVPVEHDLQFFDRLRRRAETQQSGAIAFPLGASGDGKTSAVFAASVLMPDHFEPVLTVPATVQVCELGSWLADNLLPPTDKAVIVRMDGREASDDTVGPRHAGQDRNGFARASRRGTCR